VTRAWRFAVEHYLVLPLGALIAIVWAGADAVSYFRVAQALAFAVNDIGMALVLAYLAQEVVEAALPGGMLHPWRRALVPVIAGVGGSLGAVAVYAAYIHAGDEDVLAQGWPIACAVDILLCLAIARSIFRRSVAVSFLLLLVITSDVVGLTVISQRHLVAAVHPAAGVLIVAAIGASVVLKRAGVRSFWSYLCLPGLLAWLGCYWAGMHPALALLPIVPFFSHSARDLGGIARHSRGAHRTASHFESVFEYPVQVIAFLLGLINAGVLLRGFGTGTWAVLTASLVGRPIGILAAVGIAVAGGLRLPRLIGWRELIVIALAASPSLAFGLFFAAAVFPNGPLLIETRIGAILTAAVVVLALAVARLLRVGRFASLTVSQQGIGAQLRGRRA
jgi:Na+:H+ antiporter, NhaA family